MRSAIAWAKAWVERRRKRILRRMHPDRAEVLIELAPTPFGNHHVVLSHVGNRVIGVVIKDPAKEPDAQVRQLVDSLGAAFDRGIKGVLEA